MIVEKIKGRRDRQKLHPFKLDPILSQTFYSYRSHIMALYKIFAVSDSVVFCQFHLTLSTPSSVALFFLIKIHNLPFSVSNDPHLHWRSRPCNLTFHTIKHVLLFPLMRQHTCCGSSFITPVFPSRMRLFLIAVSFLFSFDGEWEVISSFSLGISMRETVCQNMQTICLSDDNTVF